MNEKPILFNGDMVRAILSGRKTQTRRVVKLPNHCSFWNGIDGMWTDTRIDHGIWHVSELPCPYGQVGDVLWVRETFCNVKTMGFDKDLFPLGYAYKADCTNIESLDIAKDYGVKWKPSIHMPKEACRIRLEITDIRVERLQDISEEDILAEGVKQRFPNVNDQFTPKILFGQWMELWQDVYGADSWNENPWVWVVEFKPI